MSTDGWLMVQTRSKKRQRRSGSDDLDSSPRSTGEVAMADKSLLDELKATIETALQPVHEKLKDMATARDVQSLRQDLERVLHRQGELETRMDRVEGKIQSMEETPLPPKSVSNSINALEQYTRRNSLRIRGIPEVDRKTGEMCIHKVVNFCRIKLGLDLQPECIDRAHRVGRKENATAQRVMLVKFVSWQDRDRVFRARSKLKGKRDDQDKPLLILADLTRENMRIFSAALSAKNRGRIKDTWVNANCRIMIILTDNTRKNIDCVEDLS
ncbi:Hypp9540 [Branchiostoma lanceolatum]|uniref:Hypp9540 protein n=1 Tax=Branchiostoma lanceolatum TaxID=7740 RepID=A0A8S4MP22_BRALA|nr:Hypp9540 [Branchiostoma lanceolatum]